jgi:hypothetical protein
LLPTSTGNNNPLRLNTTLANRIRILSEAPLMNATRLCSHFPTTTLSNNVTLNVQHGYLQILKKSDYIGHI